MLDGHQTDALGVLPQSKAVEELKAWVMSVLVN